MSSITSGSKTTKGSGKLYNQPGKSKQQFPHSRSGKIQNPPDKSINTGNSPSKRADELKGWKGSTK